MAYTNGPELQIAIDNGAGTIEINPEGTPISTLFDRRMRTSATLALKELFPKYI